MTKIPTGVDVKGRKLYLATVIDLYSRRLLGTGPHPDGELACAAIKMAVAARCGVDPVDGPNWRQDESQRVIFHTDRGSTYTANSLTKLSRRLGNPPVHRQQGRVVLRQRRGRGILLLIGVGGSLTTRPQDRRPSSDGCTGLVLRVLQLPPLAQLGCDDEPDQLREHRGPRPGSRMDKPSTVRGSQE